MGAEIVQLKKETTERIELRDGSAAERVGDALEVRDPRGRLLLRFCDGEAELVAADGDLRLSAPRGAVVIDAAEDVVLEARRDVVQRPQRAAVVEAGDTTLHVGRRKVSLETDAVAIASRTAGVEAAEATVVARQITTHAERLATRVEHYELSAGRLVERSRDAFREVVGLLQTKAARTRTLVSGVSSLFTQRTVMVSEQDTSIDGDKILLG